MRYSPFEFLPQNNEGKVADESQAEEAVKAEMGLAGCFYHCTRCIGSARMKIMEIRGRCATGRVQ